MANLSTAGSTAYTIHNFAEPVKLRRMGGMRHAVAGLLFPVALLAACSEAEPSSAPPQPTQTPVTSEVPELQPGAPGAETTPRDPSTPIGADRAAEEDIAFMQMMLIHHRQALDMSALAQTRAGAEDVRLVAGRITAAQGPEILSMAAWLTERNVSIPEVGEDPAQYDHAEHGHPGMAGMLTSTQMDDLADASGAEFDRLYLTGMIQHHRGAIEMASSVLALGSDQRVNELATDISAEQSIEIGRLERILAGL
jgi:uncharacterized protein (DUF305 family)